MIDINKEASMSIEIANNFENISNKSTMICDRVKKDLFNEELYSETITCVTKDKKDLESLVLLNKELVKQYTLSVTNTCKLFSKECNELILKRDAKDNINNGRNVNVSKTLFSIDNYYTFNIDQDSDLYNPNFIKIESNVVEEIGSVDKLLHTYLPTLCTDISYVCQYVTLVLNQFLSKTDDCVEKINNIMTEITSPEVIISLNNKGTSEDNSPSVAGAIDGLCENICIYSKLFKFFITKIMALLTVIKINFDIQEEALNQYIVTESLL